MTRAKNKLENQGDFSPLELTTYLSKTNLLIILEFFYFKHFNTIYKNIPLIQFNRF